MAMPWYEWGHIRQRLLSYGRAVQGVSPYRIAFEPDRAKCPSGYTNFTRQLIMVNPAMFDTAAREQYDLTKAALCHEAGHRRFTTPSRLPPHVALVSNILEDERIERLMEEEFAGVRGLLRKLSAQLLGEAQPLNPRSDDPSQVLNYILQLRWSERSGTPIKGELSTKNRERWALIEPLVRECWSADTSLVCDGNAREIVDALGIMEPDVPEWLKKILERLEFVDGERGPGDPAETASPTGEFRGESTESGEPFDGEHLPREHGAGSGSHSMQPRPYLDLVDKVQPSLRRLIEELSVHPRVPPPEPSERGGRLSVRQSLREPERPFLLPQERPPRARSVTFRVVIDHSTSMNYGGRIEYAAQAAMLLHLAAVELDIPHEIAVAPHDLRLANLESGEVGLALIAGIVPAQTGWEDTGLAVSRHGKELLSMSEEVRLLLVIHDGMGNDHELLAEECKRLRSEVLVLGIGIGMGESEAALLMEQFGSDRYIICATPEDLPARVGAVLRAVRST